MNDEADDEDHAEYDCEKVTYEDEGCEDEYDKAK